jgi:hypothetical protein
MISCPNYFQINGNITTGSKMSIVCNIYGVLALLYPYTLNASHFEQRNGRRDYLKNAFARFTQNTIQAFLFCVLGTDLHSIIIYNSKAVKHRISCTYLVTGDSYDPSG